MASDATQNDAAKPPSSSLIPHPSSFRKFALYRPATFRFADWLTRQLPRAVLRALAIGLADASYLLFPHLRRNIESNLRHVFPADRARVRSLVRCTFRNYGLQLLDYSYCSHLSNDRFLQMFARIEGTTHLDAVLQRGRGAIILTAHLGNWELGGVLFALHGYRLNAVTREEHLDQLTHMRAQYRAARGVRTIPIGRSPFAFIDIMEALRRNEVVAMLVERPSPQTAIQVEFFGKLALFSSGPAVLAMTTGAAILPGFITRLPDGRYHAQLREPIPLETLGDRTQTIRHHTQQIARVMEAVIREHPDQWFNFVPIWGG